MSIVNTIESVREWLDLNLCQKVKLKQPNDTVTDGLYPYKLVHPAVFSLFIPADDKLPPEAQTGIPSICVQLAQGEDNLIQKSRNIKIRLCFSAWDPGLHAPDIINSQGRAVEKESFQKNSDGWLDAWNFLDTALRTIENAEYINGFRLIKEEGVTFGMVTDQENAAVFYPLWYAWAEFSLGETLTRNPSYSQLL